VPIFRPNARQHLAHHHDLSLGADAEEQAPQHHHLQLGRVGGQEGAHQVVTETAATESIADAVCGDDAANCAERRKDEAGLADAVPVEEDPAQQRHEQERVGHVVEVSDQAPLG
jgi:hypothetical protein